MGNTSDTNHQFNIPLQCQNCGRRQYIRRIEPRPDVCAYCYRPELVFDRPTYELYHRILNEDA